MKTPEEKYRNDPIYRQIVDMCESLIVQCQLTPSEIREAVMFACVRHEMQTVRNQMIYPNTG